MIPATYDPECAALLRLLVARTVINAAFAVFLLLDPPETFAVLLPRLAVFGLLDGSAAALLGRILYRIWPREPFWVSSLMTGIARLGLALVVTIVPDVAENPLLLLLFIAIGSTIAAINGVMKLRVAAYLRRGGRHTAPATGLMMLGMIPVTAAVIAALTLDATVATARPLLLLISAVEAAMLALAAMQAARTEGDPPR